MNGGVIEIGLRHRHRGLLLLHLRQRLGDGCPGRGHRRIVGVGGGFRQVELLLAHDAFFGQSRGPLIVGSRLQRAGLRFFQIGLGRHHVGFGVRQIGLGLQQTSPGTAKDRSALPPVLFSPAN